MGLGDLLGRTKPSVSSSFSTPILPGYVNDYQKIVDNTVKKNGFTPYEYGQTGGTVSTGTTGLNQSALTDAASQKLMDTLYGKGEVFDQYRSFLSPQTNPYLDAMYGQAANQIGNTLKDYTLPSIDSRFGAGGRSGSGLYAKSLGDAMDSAGRQVSDFANNFYGNAYETGMNRKLQALGSMSNMQQNALSMVPTYSGTRTTNSNNQYGYRPTSDMMQLQGIQSAYQPLLNLPMPTYGTQTTPLYKNVGAGILGGASSGAALGSVIPGLGTGMGALLGAGIGLL